MIDWDTLIAHPRLIRDLYDISRQMRYTAPELLTGYIAWLQYNLREYELTKQECLSLIYNFSFALDEAQRGEAA